MKRNDQSLYEAYAHRWWDNPLRWQRMLINQERPRLKYFDRVAPDWQGLTVLDLGCGGGLTAEALARRGAKVIGVDPGEKSLAVAHKHAQPADLAIDYRPGVGEAIPLEAQSVDRIVCVDVLEHVENLEQVLREVHRVLRPQGLFFFTTVNRNWLSSFLSITMAEYIFRIIPRGTHEAARYIRPAELQRMLEQIGFTVKPGAFVGLGPVGINRRFDFIFGTVPVTWMQYIGYAISH